MLIQLVAALLQASTPTIPPTPGLHYRIVASIASDLSRLDARAELSIPRTAFGSVDSVRIALGGTGKHRLLLNQPPVLAGQVVP